MLIKISIIVALCSGTHYADVTKKMSELRQAYPEAVVTARVDKRAQCADGMVLTGRDAKLLEQLAGK